MLQASLEVEIEIYCALPEVCVCNKHFEMKKFMRWVEFTCRSPMQFIIFGGESENKY